MWAEYISIVRVLRRPMRRWWLKTGVWWLGAYVVAAIYDTWYQSNIYMTIWPQAGQVSSDLVPLVVLNAISRIVKTIAGYSLWLLAAQHACSSLYNLVERHAVPAVRNMPVLYFLLALSQGGWILLLSASHLAIGNLIWYATVDAATSSPPIIYPPAYFVDSFFAQAIQLALAFGWIAALLAASGINMRLAWIWLGIGAFLPTILASMQYLFFLLQTNNFPIRALSQNSITETSLVWLVSLLIMISMVDALRLRRIIFFRLLFGAMLVSFLVSNAGGSIPQLTGNPIIETLTAQVANWTIWLDFMPAGFVASTIIPDAEFGKLVLNLPPLHHWFWMPDFLHPVASLINAAWVVFVWWLICFFGLGYRRIRQV